MPREKEDFREYLVRLDAAFPGMELITMNQACKYLRKDSRTLKRDKTFPIKRVGKTGFQMIPIVGLARWLAS